MSDRQVIRCPHCNLRQFITASTMCRKCTKPLLRPVSGACEPVQAQSRRLRTHFSEVIPTRVKELRTLRNMSQRTLATHIHAHRTWVSGLERGFRVPTIDSVERICLALQVPFHIIFWPDEQFVTFMRIGGRLEACMAEQDYPAHADGLAV